jgi:chromosome partitioning protein
MATVVAFVSQKGGVGKSTLARGLAASAARAGLKVKTVDLDPQQATITIWAQARERNKVSPPIHVDTCLRVKDALATAREEGLLIIDAPGNISDELAELTDDVDLLVQPTSPTVDDLYPAVLVFQALERVGMARRQLAFALCRTLAEEEALSARSYLDSLGYAVLEGDVPESLDYRKAMNEGRAITETDTAMLSGRAKTMIADLLSKAGEKSGEASRLAHDDAVRTRVIAN